ncbi:MAG: nuclear transport factor 2 family protein [Defluviicoccus sp.]|nr:nuclear transport factor 2 family protein [Defluviicoccus sp.]MDE0380850.1 nuclear transport factor 2 family protein [Rhodospirillales bacterium]
MAIGGGVTVETVSAVVEAFNRHDVDAIMGYFAADVVWLMARGPDAWGRRFEGARAVREALADRFRSIPDAHWQDRGSWVSGEVGVSEWTLTGTTAKGERLEVQGCDLWRFRDGKVIVKDTYWKHIEQDFT